MGVEMIEAEVSSRGKEGGRGGGGEEEGVRIAS